MQINIRIANQAPASICNSFPILRLKGERDEDSGYNGQTFHDVVHA